MMSNEEQFKLALFAVIRNSQVMPAGLKLGKSMDEINDMARLVMDEVIKSCDFEKLSKDFYGVADRKTLNAVIIERDDSGNIIGCGSHADYDYYATEVQNGQGYYDSSGHFHRRVYNPED